VLDDPVDQRRDQRPLHVDLIADLGRRFVVAHEQHRRVHVRWLEELEPASGEVERAATAGEWLDAVRAARSDEHEVSVGW
jgi:hypothetical protein